MSSFVMNAVNKKTKEVKQIWCLDGLFGNHKYGYTVGISGNVMTEKEFYDQFEPLTPTQEPRCE